MALGLRTSASGSVAGIEEASVRALLKLEQVLPPRLRHRVAALHGFIVPLGSRGPTVDAERLSAIAGACRDHEGIRFAITTVPARPAGASSSRTGSCIPDIAGIWWPGILARKDWRTFRVDRIEGKLKTSTRFKPRKPPGGDFAAFVSKSLASVPYPIRARDDFARPRRGHRQARAAFCRACWKPSTNALACSTPGPIPWKGPDDPLDVLGVDFQVHEPPELIDHLRRVAERLRSASS